MIALACAVAASGCGKQGGAGGGPPGGMAVHVVGFAAKRQPLEESISLVGTVMANEAVELRSELDGTIEEIDFEEGQPVTKDQVLARIDQKKLQASMAEADARLQLAKSTLERYTALAESRAVSQQEVDQAQATYETDKATLDLMQAQLEDAVVRAPFDGIIGERRISAGQYITKGTTITSLIDPDPMKAEFRVPERYIAQIAAGQPVQMTVAAYPDETFSGKVYFVGPEVEESTRTVLVKALVPNGEGKLRSGMFANLRLVMQIRKDALVIPETALIVQGQHTIVFVVDERNTVQPRPVKPGARLAGLVEVVDGLRAGETVVIEGTQKLGPGANVVVRFEDPSSAVALPGAPLASP